MAVVEDGTWSEEAPQVPGGRLAYVPLIVVALAFLTPYTWGMWC